MTHAVEPETTLYVAAGGRDTWSGRHSSPVAGSVDGPFATLERARDEIRALKAGPGGLPAGGVAVEVAAGVHSRGSALDLTDEDSGSPEAPVVWAGSKDGPARLLGGTLVPGFAAVSDPDVLARLPDEARSHVVEADLRHCGIEDFGQAGTGGLELFYDGQPMTLARWPNEGFVKIADLVGGEPIDVRGTVGDGIGKFVYEGDRSSRWVAEKDPWAHGYWFWDWSDERHRIESIDPEDRVMAVAPPYHRYGYRIGQWYYGYNLLCELDRPGEWYLDRDSGILYFWPPGPVEGVEICVSGIDTLISADGVENVTFRDLTFELGRGTAAVLANCTHVRIESCTFRNLGAWAVQATGGENVVVVSCDVYQTGGGGISLTGGDRAGLTPGRHLAVDNHIHHYGRINRMYMPAIAIGGVGHRVAHNLIHDAPHMAVSFSGNDHVIELNEIHHVCTESNDAGAIYAGRDWTWRGTVIRHNLFYEITGFEGRGCVGVYLDDMLCGTEISGNLFHHVTRAAFIGGGRDCTVVNNLFVDCEPALHVDARALNWASYHVGTTMRERLEEMPYRDPQWMARHPELLTLWEDEPGAPKGNVIEGNVCQGGTWDEVGDDARPYVTLGRNLVAEDVGLVGDPPGEFRLKASSAAWAMGFAAIPVAEIGPRRRISS